MLRFLLMLVASLAATSALAADPQVTVTLSPGYSVVAPGAATITVTAISPDELDLTSVKLYQNGVLIDTKVSPDAPYSVPVSNLAIGTYVYRAVAVDQNNNGGEDSKTLTVTSSSPPSVSISVTSTGPYTTPASINFSATASDADGSVTKVEFSSGSSWTFTDTTAPYAATWSNAPAGTHYVSAKAYDNTGTTKIANTTIVVNAKPSVAMSTPTANQVLPSGNSVVLSAVASDPDDGVAMVEFYVGSQLVGSDVIPAGSYSNGTLTQTYSVVWNGVPGQHTVFAKVIDHSYASVSSAAVTFKINSPPSISLTSPANGSTVTLPASLSLLATASDTDDTVASVKFYVDGALVGTDTSAPYSYSHPQGTVGVVTVEAVATDTRGATSSSTAYVTVKSATAGSTVLSSRKYVYDLYERLCKVIEPETGSTTTQYDEAGNVIWTASGLDLPDPNLCNRGDASYLSGHRVDRTYDARNRLKTVRFPDGRGNLDYTYEPDGQVKTLVAHNDGVGVNVVTTTYTHNSRGLLTREQMDFGSVAWPIDYTYTANGHLASQTYHGLAIDYAPNALGQPTKAGTFASGVQYYPNGAIRQFLYGNGLRHKMAQNTRGLPQKSCDTLSDLAVGTCNTGAFLNDTYTYDQNANVTVIDDGRIIGTVPDRTDRKMQYDNLDRLLSVESPLYSSLPASKATYSYDVLDNLTHVVAPGRDNYYCYDVAGRLTNLMSGAGCTGTTVMGLGYDDQGNLANRSGREYFFDYGNRLREVEADVSKPNSTYVYDGLGRRVRDYTGAMGGRPAGSKYSQYSQEGQLLQASDARAGVFSEYVYLGGSLVAIRERTGVSGAYVYKTKYQHTDALGSPVIVSTETLGYELNDYEPYGKVLGAEKDGPGYTGHVLDAATGLNYMEQRYYDPSIGRFLSVDPVTADSGTGANFNRYWYANNNPYKFTDPDGRIAFCAVPPITFICLGAAEVILDGIIIGLGGAAIASPILVQNEAPAPVAGDSPDPNGPSTSETKPRGKEGADGGQSEITKEKDGTGRTIATTHTVKDKDGNVIHGHTDHYGENGSRRRFSDELTGEKTTGEGKQEPMPKDNGPKFPREPVKGGRYY